MPSNLSERRPFSAVDHVLYAFCWTGFVAVLVLAAWLKPSPNGLGTHTELHLPPCGFYMVFHKPCPSCGMTTSFAWLMHGHPIKALRTQPAGVAVFLASLAAWLYLPRAWFKRRPFVHIFDLRAFLPSTVLLIAIILMVWIWRLIA